MWIRKPTYWSHLERVFGLDDASDIYKGYGRRLVERGFAVIAPIEHQRGPPACSVGAAVQTFGQHFVGAGDLSDAALARLFGDSGGD